MDRRAALISILVSGFVCSPGLAEQRALLVGVGQYKSPDDVLPGIDLDLERMRETLNRMGFADEQIRTLMDAEATSANVVAAFSGWLREGVKPEDRVVFYYSGHGSNVPDADKDEPDGVDEVLVTYDVRRVRVKGRPSLAGVVTDDRLAQLIGSIPSRNIWIVVDACHSGTMARSFKMKNRSLGAEPVFVKSYSYPGMPEGTGSELTRDFERGPEPNFVALSAAGDGEKAIGTMKGGVFTIALTDAIAEAASESRALTVNELRERAAQYIARKVDKDQVHHPQVTGSTALAQGKLAIVPASVASGPNRKKLLELAAAHARHFEIQSPKGRYAVEEPVQLKLTLPAAGYLNLVTVDSKDNATVLFPNGRHTENRVSAGPFSIPTPEMQFDVLAAEPLGPTLVVAFLSTDPINFHQETLESRDENGNVTVDFPSLSHSATRALRIAPRKRETWSAQLELEIVKGGTP